MINFELLRGNIQVNPPPGTTLFGLTGTDIGTLLAALATFAVLFALYTVSTVRDPMARRVTSLTERRAQLKAANTAPRPRRRATLATTTQTTDGMRHFHQTLKVLTQAQVPTAQANQAQADNRE